MRYGVLADVHANLPALRTAISTLRSVGADAFVCLGDLVGYGPQPNECVETIAEIGMPCVVGNHDLVACGRDEVGRAGESARPSLEWTREEISDDARAYLRELPVRVELEGGVLAAHGSLSDPWHYVRRPPDVRIQLAKMKELGDYSVWLYGHTHRVSVGDGRRSLATSDWVLARRRREVSFSDVIAINPGAVGQSREPRRPARFGLFDLDRRWVRLFAVPYPYDECRRELERRGLSPYWCHDRPTMKKTVRQVLRDMDDRRGDV